MSVVVANYYKRLGVHRSSTPEELKVAYRLLAKKAHPDTSRGKIADFHTLTDAYNTLVVDAKRRAYDRQLDQETEICVWCKGNGYIGKQVSLSVKEMTPCKECGGSGRI